MRKQTIKVHDDILYDTHLQNSKKILIDVTFSEFFSCHTTVSQVSNLTFAVVSFWEFLHYLHNNVF